MRFALVPCLLLVCAAPLAAGLPLVAPNAPPGVVSGLVLDATGAAVPGAAVLLDRATAPPRETFTDPAGRFVFDGVPPGPATLSIRLPQFRPVTLAVHGPATDIRVRLEPAAITEHVTVRGTPIHHPAITTATRTDTLLRDVPQAITVVARASILEQGMQTMADVVRCVPGVGMAQGEGHRDAPVFRGNISTGDFYVDGVKDDVQYFRDLYNVERVEALKGPNAMLFGRGGAGGVINRVTRQADGADVHEATAQLGSFDNRRVTFDLGRKLSGMLAGRVTGVYEDSASFRRGVSLERYGVNPTVSLRIGQRTTLTGGYEHFHDERTTDRGVPSSQGRPLPTDPSLFFGDPAASRASATVDAWAAGVDHRLAGGTVVRGRLRLADYDKFYQNVFPGATSAAETLVQLSAYNHGTSRRNLFGQAEVESSRRLGAIDHRVLVGVELGRQLTDNTRNTGYFPGDKTSTTVPVASPTVAVPVVFRQSATDADSHGVADVAAAFVQDQVEITKYLQAIVGLRLETFGVEFRNNRTGAVLSSRDRTVAPRAGLVLKPVAALSFYGSYSVAYAPRAGEQLSSLTVTNRSLEPEEFRNYEVGAKWDARPDLSLTAALYRLDRRNVAVPDPLDPARSLLVDGQRSRGLELGASGRVRAGWTMTAAYAWQDGEITHSQSASAKAGARLAHLPTHSGSLWNRYDLTPSLGLGVGVIRRGAIHASTDNTVRLPAFTRVDGALFLTLSPRLRAQLNVENAANRRYYASAHSNNNIMPGAPRAVRVTLTTGF